MQVCRDPASPAFFFARIFKVTRELRFFILGNSGQRIYVLEDNVDDEALTVRALGKFAPEAAVEVYRDGASAIEAAKSFETSLPNLVLLDLKLPRMDGIEVVTHLRKLPRWRHIPVVMLTSSDEPSDVARAYAAGATGFVKKPVPYPEYLEAIRHLAEYWLRINIVPHPETTPPPS